MSDHTPAETAQTIEKFMAGLQYETRLYPDLWSRRLAMVLHGEADPGPMRTNEHGVLIMVNNGEPVDTHTKEEESS